MELSLSSKIGGLIEDYPFLLDFLLNKSAKFKKLSNPILRKTLAKAASISQAASLGGLSPDTLLIEIAEQIYLNSNDPVTIVNPGGRGTPKVMTREERVKAFKNIVLRVHGGETLNAVREEFHELLQDVSPAEVGAMEQALVADGIDESEIKRLCNLHVELFESSVDSELPEMAPGHPIHTMQAENREAARKAERLDEAVKQTSDDLTYAAAHQGLQNGVNELADIIRHYERKENQLFPIMESHGLTAPPQVMWAIHDDIRQLFKQTRAELETNDREKSLSLISNLSVAVRDLIHKEETIMFPMCFEAFSEEDWVKVRLGEEEIGFAWVVPGNEWQPASDKARASDAGPGLVSLEAGELRPEVVNAILKSLPVDLSFVDAKDRVAYFSQTEHRIFPRSEGIIGREVSKCHPPKSVHMVQEILEKLKSGERDVAEFWIQMNEAFIHIRFYAIRQTDGTYEGCLEVAQDVTHIRALTGEQRLL
ncbi:DUF438 domain-containing protein, partial [Desulfovibrio sp. Huiquan2017]|uniref:DUF438 domain-containing protein n=1 Tax=Desulfovibrio sp. Huiquan2017 TaxID=2816861 RepID=UPI001A91F766